MIKTFLLTHGSVMETNQYKLDTTAIYSMDLLLSSPKFDRKREFIVGKNIITGKRVEDLRKKQKRVTEYVNGVKDGRCVMLNNAENEIYRCYYRDGKLHGPWVGKLLECSYWNGKLSGEYIEYSEFNLRHSNAKKKSLKMHFLDGKRHGEEIKYLYSYSNTDKNYTVEIIKTIHNYKKDVKHGGYKKTKVILDYNHNDRLVNQKEIVLECGNYSGGNKHGIFVEFFNKKYEDYHNGVLKSAWSTTPEFVFLE